MTHHTARHSTTLVFIVKRLFHFSCCWHFPVDLSPVTASSYPTRKRIRARSQGGKKLYTVFSFEGWFRPPAITHHIPGKSFQLVRYYGWYSNKILIFIYLALVPIVLPNLGGTEGKNVMPLPPRI
jgi:hypothetical protein